MLLIISGQLPPYQGSNWRLRRDWHRCYRQQTEMGVVVQGCSRKEHVSTTAPDRQSIWGGVAWDDRVSSWEQPSSTQCAGAFVVSWSRLRPAILCHLCVRAAIGADTLSCQSKHSHMAWPQAACSQSIALLGLVSSGASHCG